MKINLNVNGKNQSVQVENRSLLVEVLREGLGLTGTHVGCDTSQCGACLVQVDGQAVKACAMFAWEAEGTEITTIEGLAKGDTLTPMQQAFQDNHGLQCGFCTPGMVMAATDLLGHTPKPSADEVKEALVGNICRCTGYHNIIKSVMAASGQTYERPEDA